MSAATAAGMLVVALVVAGCTMRSPPPPEEIRAQALPGLDVPDTWQSAGAEPGSLEESWLTTFDDAVLNELVAEALANNPDLKPAAARVGQAAAYVEAAGAGLLPQVAAIGNVSGKDSSSGTLNFVGAFASWELDLWGRVRSGRESARMQLLSAELANRYGRESMAAMVARAWFLAIEASLQKAVADDMVVAAEKLVSLARDRARVGAGSEYDVSVADATLLGYRDTAAQMDASRRQSVQAIERIVGRYPAAELEVATALPDLPGPVPAGLPSELLERRPDVVAAERQVATAFHRTEEAKAARLPAISLTGAVSSLSSDLVVLKKRDDPVFGFGGRASVPLYLGGSLQAQVKVRTAEQKEAVAEYGRAGANAFTDVEKALSAGFALDARERLLVQAVAENQRALDIAQTRYRVGSDDLRFVEQQQLRLHGAKSALLRVQGEQLVQRVNLHLALGGSFEDGGS
ncbi:MAG: TolC family protein [Gammaproteobacteria bacterium]|nr:TolC family protein [Gammaproteobacteria bacterium]